MGRRRGEEGPPAWTKGSNIKNLLIAGGVAALLFAGGVASAQPVGAFRDGQLTEGEAAARADARFTWLNGNHDGRLTRRELRDARQARAEQRAERGERRGRPQLGQRRRLSAARTSARLDRNNDGFITRAEFRAPALERFARHDANRDGRLTRVERPAAGRR